MLRVGGGRHLLCDIHLHSVYRKLSHLHVECLQLCAAGQFTGRYSEQFVTGDIQYLRHENCICEPLYRLNSQRNLDVYGRSKQVISSKE